MDAETVQAAPALAAHLQNSPVRRASTVAVLRGFWQSDCLLPAFCYLDADDLFVFPLIYCSSHLH